MIFESSPFDRKGRFNSVHNRIGHLKQLTDISIDVYCLHIRDNFITRRFRGTKKVPKHKSVVIDGIEYRMMWRRFSLSDRFRKMFGRQPEVLLEYVSDVAGNFGDYDLVLAHSYEGGLLAREVSRRFAVPYMVTWHGSDVHTHPLRDSIRLRLTRQIMEGAEMNFFVSKALMADSDKLTENAPKDVLYNGVSDMFSALEPEQRNAIRRKYSVSDNERVVAYVGNFYPVKNVTVLPELFSRIYEGFESHIAEERDDDAPHLKFWLVGDGKLRPDVEHHMKRLSGTEAVFWGNVSSEEMPEMMNCIDLLVIPSCNEGLPLVAMEALKSGAEVIGSHVGGIPEVIGNKFTVPFRINVDGSHDYSDSSYISGMARLAVRQLLHPSGQTLDPVFDWRITAERELRAVETVLGREKQKN